MRITVFVGPSKCGGDALRAHLRANEALLAELGACLCIDPDHSGLLAKHMRIGGDPQKFLDAASVPDDAHSLLLWDETLLGPVDAPFGKRFWYGTARARMENVHKYFEQHEVYTALATRDPADLIPALYAENLRRRNLIEFKNFIGQVPIEKLQWSELIERVQLRDEYKPVLAWSQEDYAYIWRDVIEALVDIPNGQVLVGDKPEREADITIPRAEYHLASMQKLSADGTKIDDTHWAQFLETHEELVGLTEHPAWTQDRQEQLSEIYDEDLYSVARMDAVHFLERRPRF